MHVHDTEVQTTFADLGLPAVLLKAVRELNYNVPTPIQYNLIPIAMLGHDVIGQAKTGTGKTAAFALPMLARLKPDAGTQALVLAPTRELAQQIADDINLYAKYTKHKAAAIIGGESAQKQIRSLRSGASIVVGTPGRVMDLHGRGEIDLSRVQIAVLDEVDRMLDIGFRDAIRQILRQTPEQRQTIFVSATVAGEIEQLAKQFMKRSAFKVTTSTDEITASNIQQFVLPVQPMHKKQLLRHLLATREVPMAIVFCRTKRRVSELAKYLRTHRIDSAEIHGDLPQAKRTKVLKQMHSGELRVLVASDVAARGLDIDDITHVINFDLPDTPEAYVHRIGRTARAGKTGVAWAFSCPGEGQLLTQIEMLTGVMLESLDLSDFDAEALGGRPAEVDASEQSDARLGRGDGSSGRGRGDRRSSDRRSSDRRVPPAREPARANGWHRPTPPVATAMLATPHATAHEGLTASTPMAASLPTGRRLAGRFRKRSAANPAPETPPETVSTDA